MLLLGKTILRIVVLVLFGTPRRCGQILYDSTVSVVEVHEYLLQLCQLGILASVVQSAPLREASVSVLRESI